jgi:PTS system nitrogen regulatory IIA component
MRLTELLTPARVRTELDTADKHGALSALAALLAGDDDHTRTQRVLAALLEREELASTGVGSGVAIPHGQLDIDDVRMALAISPEGVPFETVDGAPVHILAAIVGPKAALGAQLRLLARTACLLRDQGIRARLRGAVSPADALEVMAQEEMAL